MSWKMWIVLNDCKLGIAYDIFHGNKNPIGNCAFMKKTKDFWELDNEEMIYLKKELDKYLRRDG